MAQPVNAFNELVPDSDINTYFSKQGGDLTCGVHAINNLMRGEYTIWDNDNEFTVIPTNVRYDYSDLFIEYSKKVAVIFPAGVPTPPAANLPNNYVDETKQINLAEICHYNNNEVQPLIHSDPNNSERKENTCSLNGNIPITIILLVLKEIFKFKTDYKAYVGKVQDNLREEFCKLISEPNILGCILNLGEIRNVVTGYNHYVTITKNYTKTTNSDNKLQYKYFDSMYSTSTDYSYKDTPTCERLFNDKILNKCFGIIYVYYDDYTPNAYVKRITNVINLINETTTPSAVGDDDADDDAANYTSIDSVINVSAGAVAAGAGAGAVAAGVSNEDDSSNEADLSDLYNIPLESKVNGEPYETTFYPITNVSNNFINYDNKRMNFKINKLTQKQTPINLSDGKYVFANQATDDDNYTIKLTHISKPDNIQQNVICIEDQWFTFEASR